ncbi:unnamed protein product [Peniophora sp. CBMAI 1063]|nr:unnamed protein product [Peniophora sp. CBMAI 1063]
MHPKLQRASIQDAWLGFVRSRFEPLDQANGTYDLSASERAEMELGIMSESFALAKQYRNKVVSGACRLPAKILNSIFAMAQEGWDPSREECPGRSTGATRSLWKFTRGWMGVTEVCHTWREESVGCPALWTHIPCLGVEPSRMPIILARSRRLPLTLRFEPPSNTSNEHTNSILSALQMWLSPIVLRRTMRLDVGSQGEVNQVFGIFCDRWLMSVDTPALKELEFKLESGANTTYLRENFCAEKATPPITRLNLRNCLVHPSSPLLSKTLTSLSLHTSEWASSLAYTTDIRLIIAGMENLQELCLANVAPCSYVHDSVDVIFPGCFRKLDVRLDEDQDDTNMAMVQFLKGVVLPAAARASYQFDEPAALAEEDLRSLVPGLLSGVNWKETRVGVLMTADSISLRPLIDTQDGDNYPDCQTILEAVDQYAFGTCQDRRFSADIFDTHYSSPLGCLGDMLPCDRMQALHLNAAVLGYFLGQFLDKSDEQFVEECSSFRNVRRLTVESSYHHHRLFFNVLSMRHPATGAPDAVFPRLRTLVLLQSSLPSHTFRIWREGSADARREIILVQAGLDDLLESRAAANCPIEDIIVDQAYSALFDWSSITGNTTVRFVNTRRAA